MKKALVISLIAAFALNGCQTLSENKRTAFGSAIGVVAGSIIGGQVGDTKGAVIGAAVGALAGGAVGQYMDRQQRQLEQQMQGSGVSVARVDEQTLKLNIPNEVLFATNQSQITPNFYPILNRLAETLTQYPNTIIHVYGFTDGSGSPSYNQQLSQTRASNTAQYLQAQNIPLKRFVVQGYGERFARAETNPNDRRVEILIKALRSENPQAAYQLVY